MAGGVGVGLGVGVGVGVGVGLEVCVGVGVGVAVAVGVGVGIMERMAKINGVIPDRSLVTVDQRTVHVDGGGIDLMELAKIIYQAKESEAGNGDDYVKP